MYTAIRIIIAIAVIAMIFFSGKLFFEKKKPLNRLVSVLMILFATAMAMITFFEGSLPLKMNEDTLTKATDIIKEKESIIMENVPKEIFDEYAQNFSTGNRKCQIAYKNNLTETEIEEEIKSYIASYDNEQINQIGELSYIVDDYRICRNEVYLGMPELQSASIIIFSESDIIAISVGGPFFKEVDLIEIAKSLDTDKQITELNEYA